MSMEHPSNDFSHHVRRQRFEIGVCRAAWLGLEHRRFRTGFDASLTMGLQPTPRNSPNPYSAASLRAPAYRISAA